MQSDIWLVCSFLLTTIVRTQARLWRKKFVLQSDVPYRKTKLALREYEHSLRIAFENEITPHEVKQTPSIIKSITRKAAKEEHAFAKNQTTIVEELENFARNEETWTRSSREYLLSKVSMLHAEASCLPNQEEVDPAEFQFPKRKASNMP